MHTRNAAIIYILPFKWMHIKVIWFLNLTTYKKKSSFIAYTHTCLISRVSDSSRISSFVSHRTSRLSSKGLTVKNSDSSVTSFFPSLDLSQIRGAVLRDRVEGISNSPLSGSGPASTSTSIASSVTSSASSSVPSTQKTRARKVAAAAAVHHLSAFQELLEQWVTKSKQENHSAEDRYQVLELRDKILRIRKCIIFSTVIAKKISHFKNTGCFTTLGHNCRR